MAHRLLAFTDAVVAIALTLLILPLVELPARVTAGSDIGDVLADAHNELIAFGVSFLVIWRLWVGHHRIFQRDRTLDHTMLLLTVGWSATIVFLPFPTALLSTPVADHGAVALYLSVLLISALLLLAMAWRVQRESRESGVLDWPTPLVLSVALVVAVVWPQLGPWVMLLVVPTPLFGLLHRICAGGHERRRGLLAGSPVADSAGPSAAAPTSPGQ